MAALEYLICLECETPTYDFEMRDEKVREASCSACGNTDLDLFMTEDELEEMSSSPLHGSSSHR